MRTIDMRSDTVTRPTRAMREAMMNADVGDDGFDDDPTVHRLQKRLARMFGKEEALFVPSGTMANQVAFLSHTRRGDHVIVPRGAHTVYDEAGAGPALTGVLLQELGRGGLYDLDELAMAVKPNDHHYAPTRLITLENTHNRAGGIIPSIEHIEAVGRFAHDRWLKFHIDGARAFNAMAEGQDPLAIAGPADSISVCLSKGLGAPAGSVLIGSRVFIDQAHRYRKMLGGSMRQVGFLAAAGLYALDNNVERLREDHRRARRLAEGLAEIPGVTLLNDTVQTNLVYFDLADEKHLPDGPTFVRRALELGLLCTTLGCRRLRYATHLNVDDKDIERTIKVTRRALEAKAKNQR